MPRPLLTLAALAALSVSTTLASPAQDLFNQVNTLIQEQYGGLSPVDRPALTREYQTRLDAVCRATAQTCSRETAYPVLEAEVNALNDEHSNFERPDAFQDFVASATGGSRLQFGVRLANLNGENRVVLDVVPGSTADEAGLRRGDVFQSINGQPYTYAGLREAREKGQPTTLSVQRGTQTLSVTLTARETSTRELPTLSMQGTVAVIRIPSFLAGGGVANRVHELVAQAQTNRASGIVVDLRGDPGGDLSECDGAASAFVPTFTRLSRSPDGDARTVVSRGSRLEDGRIRSSVNRPSFWSGPLSVIVDQSSASCSEFFAYEIQYAGRGKIVGEPTAGVGNTATQVFQLDDAALQLTVLNYAKPDGTPYPERVTPDIPGKDDILKLTQGEDVLLQAGIEALSTQMQPAALPTDRSDQNRPHQEN
ncbi:S41 family peptidase [Deinococcus sonorensis]|uniref:S41 family peptidase n=2 Tax=Deinococcus sonorensis TaxID=309891 RepID=A0AAU7U7A2_9DEIO